MGNCCDSVAAVALGIWKGRFWFGVVGGVSWVRVEGGKIGRVDELDRSMFGRGRAE